MTWIAGDQLLGIVDEEFYRLTSFLRQHITKRNFVGISLSTKIPADIARMNHDVRGGNLQRISHLLAHCERTFGRSPYLGAAIGLDLYNAGMGFDIGLVDRWNLKRIFNHDVGLAKSFFDVPFVPCQMYEYIARDFNFMKQSLVICQIGMKQRRRRLYRLQWVGYHRQLFVFDIDQIHSSLGGFLSFSHHGCHLFPNVSDDTVGQQRDVHDLLADPDAADILSGKNRLHAREFLRLDDIDLVYLSMGDGTA